MISHPPYPISAVVIALNEEEGIGDCVQSLNDAVDEIIVVDTGSEDNTIRVAESCGADVHQTKWLGFAQTKNWGNDRAQHDLILSIDADERLDEDMKASILQVREYGLVGIGAFKRKNYYGDHWVRFGGWYPDRKKRLFNRKSCRWRGDYVHEELISKTDTTINLKGNIIHYTVANRDEHNATIEKYARLNAKRLNDEGKSAGAVSSLFSTLWTFVKIFFVRLGFLDGRVGFFVALGSARAKWLRFKYSRQ